MVLDGSYGLFVICHISHDIDRNEVVEETYLVLPGRHATYTRAEEMFLASKSKQASSSIVSIQRLEPVYVQAEGGNGTEPSGDEWTITAEECRNWLVFFKSRGVLDGEGADKAIEELEQTIKENSANPSEPNNPLGGMVVSEKTRKEISAFFANDGAREPEIIMPASQYPPQSTLEAVLDLETHLRPLYTGEVKES